MLSKNQQKFISSLALKKFRDESRMFAVEGIKLVDELLGENYPVSEIFATPRWLDGDRERKMSRKNIRYTEVTEAELKKISQLATPNEVLAVARMPELPAFTLAEGYFLALDRVNDPGNLGTIIRICDWFGIKGLICSEGTVECYNPKTVQSSMGSLFRLPVYYAGLGSIIQVFKDGKVPVYAAVLEGESLGKVGFGRSGLIVMGSESHGIGKEVMALVDHRITIEKAGKAESLNVAVATGIICSRLPGAL